MFLIILFLCYINVCMVCECHLKYVTNVLIKPSLRLGLSRGTIESSNVLEYNQTWKLKFTKSSLNSRLKLTSFVDADYASDINAQKSISGFIVKLNDCLVGWKSKKQSVVCLSSSESE
ncbi:hypothetical protein PR048_001949 [Dryococelus australis]|uniref:Secreted protein n=1 Tax=Dryococelus australis TaxID=614101 RepID=A0ABQ9IK98_9NEOP|nr:hypothetical protein PR048_001949 [Dryococelus australis]